MDSFDIGQEIVANNGYEYKRNTMLDRRIESVDDPTVNKALFTIYQGLVAPFKEIEGKIKQKEEIEDTIALHSEEYSVVREYLHYVKYTIIPAIIVILIEAKITSDWTPASQLPLIINLLENVILWGIPSLICWGIPVLIVLWGKKNDKEIIKENQLMLANLNAEIEQNISDIADLIVFIPPNYRYSTAIQSFSELYLNSRVDNLKEAVNMYETDKHRQAVERHQAEMIELQKEQNYIALQTLDQLQGLKGAIWASEALF